MAWHGPKADAQFPAVTVDDDGTVHVPTQAIPILCSGLDVPGEPFIGDGDCMAVPLGEARVGIFPPSIVVTGTRAMESSSAVTST